MLTPTTFKSTLKIEIKPVDNLSEIKSYWLKLEKYSNSIFLSWTWIGSWLSSVKDKHKIFAISFYDNTNNIVGAAFLSAEKIRRRKLFFLDLISLNETIRENTRYTIEYNNILYDPHYSNDVFNSFFDYLRNGPINFDELQLHAFDVDNTPDIEKIAKSNNFHYLCEKISKANFINLTGFNENPDNYLPSLSKNKREQIRRSIRYFEKFGPSNIEIASNKNQALSFFKELGKLHQTYWISKGYPGSFSNNEWVKFHEHLIINNPNNIQLTKLSFGDYTVGYLYNLIHSNSVYSIQSGFNYGQDKNNRPGLVLHYFASRHAISNKLKKYDFLVGDIQYKRSLSNSFNTCAWIQIQNKSISIITENMSVKYFRLIKNIFLLLTKKSYNSSS